MSLAATLTAMDGRADLNATDAMAVRRCVFSAGETITSSQVEQLFRLTEAAIDVSEPWRGVLVEVVTDFILRQKLPTGHIDEATSSWLLTKVSAREIIRQDVTELMISLMEHAESTPWSYADAVFGLVKDIILWKRLHRRLVDCSDIERLRRVLFAQCGEGIIKVSHREAEALRELNDAFKGGPTPQNWPDLFTRALEAAERFDPPQADGAANEDGPCSASGVAGTPLVAYRDLGFYVSPTNDDQQFIPHALTAAAH